VRLIWTPPEGEQREYAFRPYDLLSTDAEAIELVGDEAWTTYDEFVRLFRRGHRRALRAALWVLRRPDEPGLRFAQLNLRANEIKIQLDDDELKETRAAIREQIAQDEDLPDDVRADLLAAYEDGEEGDPKARPSASPPSPPGTESAAADTAG
jgi:hypothetical protein